MFDVKLIDAFPEESGVYIMKNKDSTIIYIGKANNLRSRVKQYFNGQDKRLKIEYLRKEITSIEYVVTSSEMEALILESNLIKQNKPKYNTLLKDDKQYPYIEVTLDEDFPRIISSREIKNNKSKYFGPFPDTKVVGEIINILTKNYKLRTCSTLPKKKCLYAQINKCSAPCENEIEKDVYLKNINKCIEILKGNIKDIAKEYTKKMYDFSENLEFEKANECKQILEGLKYITSKQRVSNQKDEDEDIIVCKKDDQRTVVVVFLLRNGKIIGKEHFFMENTSGDNESDIVCEFIKQYYYGFSSIPGTILLEDKSFDVNEVSSLLEKINEKKVTIKVPEKGDRKKLVALAKQNAEIILNEEKTKETLKKEKEEKGINNLKELLSIEDLSRIESFDISNTSGTLNVASMIVFKDGKPNKKSYRKFKLETNGSNDYECMKEVLRRRFTDTKLLETLPNVILMDGGKGQINVAKEVLDELSLSIPICGMVKDDTHSTRGLIFNDVELDIKESSPEFKLITQIQDETHNFAINYHKSLRDKAMTSSKLDAIKGVGDSKKKALLKKFGSIENIKNASLEELTSIRGVTEDLAKALKENL